MALYASLVDVASRFFMPYLDLEPIYKGVATVSACLLRPWSARAVSDRNLLPTKTPNSPYVLLGLLSFQRPSYQAIGVFPEAISLNSVHKTALDEVRKFGVAWLAKREELEAHKTLLQEGTLASLEATVKELPGWMEALRSDSLKDIWELFRQVATDVLNKFQENATVEALWAKGPDDVAKFREQAISLSSTLDIACKLLKSKSPEMSALHSRSKTLLPKLVKSSKIAGVSVCLSQFVPELTEGEDFEVEAVTGHPASHQLLCDTFDGNSFDGIEEVCWMMDKAFQVLCKDLLVHIRGPDSATGIAAEMVQSLYTCLARMNRCLGDRGEAETRTCLIELTSSIMQLQEAIQKAGEVDTFVAAPDVRQQVCHLQSLRRKCSEIVQIVDDELKVISAMKSIAAVVATKVLPWIKVFPVCESVGVMPETRG